MAYVARGTTVSIGLCDLDDDLPRLAITYVGGPNGMATVGVAWLGLGLGLGLG